MKAKGTEREHFIQSDERSSFYIKHLMCDKHLYTKFQHAFSVFFNANQSQPQMNTNKPKGTESKQKKARKLGNFTGACQ